MLRGGVWSLGLFWGVLGRRGVDGYFEGGVRANTKGFFLLTRNYKIEHPILCFQKKFLLHYPSNGALNPKLSVTNSKLAIFGGV